MATNTTLNTAKAWHPDQVAYLPEDVVPEALILLASTVAGQIDGDEPSVRVPYVGDDGTATFVDESNPIGDAGQHFDEVVVSTHKLASLGKYSIEVLNQPTPAEMITNSLQRSLVKKANAAFLHNPSNPTGILNAAGITEGGAVSANLDPVIDAVAAIEGNDGQASIIIASPSAWADLSTLKSASGSNQSLLGAGVEAGVRSVLGVPVVVTNQAEAGTLVVIDKTAIVSAVGPIRLVRSDDAFFTLDVAAIKIAWRIGWSLMHPDRLVSLTTPSYEGS